MNRRPQLDGQEPAPGGPLRVLHVTPGLHVGGAETTLYRLVTHTPHIRHEVISIAAPEWYSSKLEEHGICVRHLNSAAFVPGIGTIARLSQLIRTSECDVVQAWMYRANLLAGVLGRLSGKPVLWNIRCSSLDPLRPASRFVAYAGGFLARWLPDFVINCSARSAALHARWGYERAEGAVIPNGYDPALLHPDEEARSATRASLGIPADRFCIGTVARWHPMKGFPVLLQAAGLLRRRGLKFTLLLVGMGLNSDNSELTALIRKNGCEDVVQLLGHRADVAELDRAFDLHVLASVGAEGFPNAVAESMLSGTPNVASDVGDAALIVDDCGWVVGHNDPGALAAAIEAAFKEWSVSPAEWKERREAGRKRIADQFSLDRMAGAYEAVWRTVASSKARRRVRTR
jgi:glycosyltransferase involved in cell wall biosynthesis